MNYLAHAYLSFNNTEVLIGNMISDYVKGKTKFNYTLGVQKGIALHRAIDNFTDTHLIVKETKEIFRPAYRLYAGAFIDVVFDHFLAKKLQQEIAFKQFTENVYKELENNIEVTPLIFQKMFPSMQQNDWLYNYQFNWAMQKSFMGLQRRAKYINEVETAFILFETNYSQLQTAFTNFWSDLYTFSKTHYNSIES
jgi:acyl carrier protein phosphodiesterase